MSGGIIKKTLSWFLCLGMQLLRLFRLKLNTGYDRVLILDTHVGCCEEGYAQKQQEPPRCHPRVKRIRKNSPLVDLFGGFCVAYVFAAVLWTCFALLDSC